MISLGLQRHYGVENGQIEERSYTIHLTAAENSWIEYTVNWRYIWREGEIAVTQQDGTEKKYPYRIRSAGFEMKVVLLILTLSLKEVIKVTT